MSASCHGPLPTGKPVRSRFYFTSRSSNRQQVSLLAYRKVPTKLPEVLLPAEAGRIIDAARHLTDRTRLLVTYAAGFSGVRNLRAQGEQYRQCPNGFAHRTG